MSTTLIELEIARLHAEASRTPNTRITNQDTVRTEDRWEGRVWQLYVGQPSEQWDTVNVLLAHIDSQAHESRKSYAEYYETQKIYAPLASDRAIGPPQELADLLAYLPLIPLEVGGLLATPILLRPPGNATLLSRPEDVGVEAYGTWTRQVGKKEVHTLYKVLPKTAPASPRVTETVKTITLP